MSKEIIGIIGLGYVGQSMAALCSLKYKTHLYDIERKKYEFCFDRRENLLNKLNYNNASHNGGLIISKDIGSLVSSTQIIILALPTNFDERTNFFDTQILDKTVKEIVTLSPETIILIKSTIPIGHVKKLRDLTNSDRIVYSPEFLQEGISDEINMKPDRIVVGDRTAIGEKVGKLLLSICKDEDVNLIYSNPDEAEAVKLFANSYLAMRVAFFNELDSFCLQHKLNTQNVIEAICKDYRIGTGYNNPSFGFGGYCLPKDSRQLSANFDQIPAPLISSLEESNSQRKGFLAQKIMEYGVDVIGIYLLRMKSKSDNFREAAVIDIIKILKHHGHKILIYEPLVTETEIYGCAVIKNFFDFQEQVDLVVINRKDDLTRKLKKTIFSRDCFGEF